MKTKSVPSVPEADSNIDISASSSNKTINPVYKYDFVINNYTNEIVCQLKTELPKICNKAVFGLEVGEQGTKHIQGFISLLKKERMTGLVKRPCFKGASFRPCRNEEALINYCQKENCEFKYGFPIPIKIIENLYLWQKKIEDLYFTEPDDRSVYWYYETCGNVGKSAFCKYMFVKHGALIVRGGKMSDICNIVFNTDMEKCRMIIFDIPRGTGGSVSYTSLEQIKDGLITNTKYETGCKAFNPPHLICFANFPPDKPEQLSQDRWKIFELGNE